MFIDFIAEYIPANAETCSVRSFIIPIPDKGFVLFSTLFHELRSSYSSIRSCSDFIHKIGITLRPLRSLR